MNLRILTVLPTAALSLFVACAEDAGSSDSNPEPRIELSAASFTVRSSRVGPLFGGSHLVPAGMVLEFLESSQGCGFDYDQEYRLLGIEIVHEVGGDCEVVPSFESGIVTASTGPCQARVVLATVPEGKGVRKVTARGGTVHVSPSDDNGSFRVDIDATFPAGMNWHIGCIGSAGEMECLCADALGNEFSCFGEDAPVDCCNQDRVGEERLTISLIAKPCPIGPCTCYAEMECTCRAFDGCEPLAQVPSLDCAAACAQLGEDHGEYCGQLPVGCERLCERGLVPQIFGCAGATTSSSSNSCDMVLDCVDMACLPDTARKACQEVLAYGNRCGEALPVTSVDDCMVRLTTSAESVARCLDALPCDSDPFVCFAERLGCEIEPCQVGEVCGSDGRCRPAEG
jgi:hypothetical protein